MLKVNLTDDKSRATGVTYVDGRGAKWNSRRTGDYRRLPVPQRAPDAALRDRQTVQSGDRRRGGGRNFAYQNMTTIKAIFDKDTYTNPFIGAGGNGVGVDDFNADNFDHGAAGFVGGSPFWVNRRDQAHLRFRYRRAPRRGQQVKAAVADTYTHHLSMDAHGAHQSYRQNYLDLDPNYKTSSASRCSA